MADVQATENAELPKLPKAQPKKKDKERGSVMFGRQKQRGRSLLEQNKSNSQPKPSCLDGCFAALLGYPGAKGGSATSSMYNPEPQPLKELRPMPKWGELSADQYGIVKCVKTISVAKEDTPGWKNQDTATANYLSDGESNTSHLLVAVCDGHGRHGDEVSRISCDRLPSHMMMQEELLKKPKKAFEVAVKSTDSDVYSSMGASVEYSGATCVSVLVDQGSRSLHVANVGDSRAVLGRQIPDAKSPRWEAIALTEDQKPDASEELSRIELCGGHVAPVDDDDGNPVGPARVWDGPNRQKPGLGMSRTIGDGCARQIGVIPDPEVTTHKLTPQDRFVLIATDGLWDSLGNEQAVYICAKFIHLPEVALKALVKAVRDEEEGQLTDDTTIVLVVF